MQEIQKERYQLDHIGVHCNVLDCKLLDFLPFKCDLCNENFCIEHKEYKNHQCKKLNEKEDKIMHPCPICNCLVRVESLANLDQTISVHMDTECGKNKSTAPKSFKCTLKNCNSSEFIEVKCEKCKTNYCLKHRFPTSHNCPGKVIKQPQQSQQQPLKTTTNTTNTNSFSNPNSRRQINIEDKEFHNQQKNQKNELQRLREEQNQKYKSSEEIGEIRIIQTNGVRIQSNFGKYETLRSIKEFINSNRTDGTCSFALCKQPDGNPFTVNQLDQSISSLGLLPISTLYMLPLNRTTNLNSGGSNNNNNNNNNNEGILSYLNPFKYFK